MALPPATDRPGQLRATFRSSEAADDAVRQLHARGIPDHDIRVNDTDDRQHMLLRQQQAESDHSAAGTGSAFFTPSQAKGAILWTAVGAVVGAVLVGPIGLLVSLGEFSDVVSLGLFVVIGALAGASAGFVYGGGRQPEVDGELRDASVDVTVGVHPTSFEQARVAIETIERTGATDAEYETTSRDPLAGGH